jgi:PII-like signaling protein
MAKQLTSTFYVSGGYLDSNSVVSSINELLSKEGGFNGQVVHMPKAFKGDNKYKLSYPVDFWKIPNGDGVKWEIKDIPALEKESDFDNFKIFIEDFKTQIGYLPISENFEVVVEGKKMTTFFKDGELNWYDSSDYIDDLVADATQLAIDTVTSGASEAFDTLKEIEEWIKTNSGKTADLTGYATEAWVKEQNYLTEHQDLSGYAKKEELPSLDGYATESWVSAEIAKAQLEGEDVDLSGYATKDDIKDFVTSGWVENQGFLTEHQDITGKQDVIEDLESIREGAAKGATALQEVPEGYATETWVGEQGFLTEHQSLEGLATEQFVTDRISEIEIPSVEGLASEAWVKEQNYLTEHQDITGKQDVIEDLETIREGAAKGSTALQEVPEGYATETWVSAEIAKAQLEGEDVDLSGYATKDDIKGLATEQFVTDRISEIEIPSVEGLASEAWVGEQGFLTEHQDITGKQDVIEDLETIREGAAKGATALQEIPEEYITNEELEAKGYLTEHQDISGLATKEDIVNFATKDELPSVEGLASEAWVGEQGFLTEHQDITGKQDIIEDLESIREGAAKGATALQSVPEEYVTNEELEAKGYLTEHQDITGKQDVIEDLETIREGAAKGATALQEIPEEYVTNEELEAKGYLTEHQDISGLATKEELSVVSGSIKTVIEDLLIPENAKESLDTLEEISAWIQSHPENAASMNEQIIALQESAHTHENKGVLDGITAEKVAVWDAAEANAKGYTDDEITKLSGIYAKKTDIEGLATETWVSAEIAKAQLEGEDVDLSGYATKDDLNSLATKEETEAVKTWVGEQGFLTEHQDITGKQDVIEDLETIREGAAKGVTALQEVPEGYATETWVGEQGFLTEHQSLEGLATKEDIANFATKDELPSVEGLASEDWVKEQNYLTEHQDITGKQDVIEDLETIREGAAKGATALQEIPEEYVTNEELEAKGYLTEHQSLEGYATKEDIADFATKDELAIVSASVKTVVEELLIPESAKESLDTIEEISAWIQSHPDDAAAMNVQIASLSADSHTHANKNVLVTQDRVARTDKDKYDNLDYMMV